MKPGNAILPVLLLAVTLLSAPSRTSAQTTRTVLIGVAMPLSGPAAAYGKSMVNAVELAVEEANRRKTRIAGQDILFKALVVDERGNARSAVLSASYLVGEHVMGVVGGGSTITTLAGAKIFGIAGIPQISPSSSAPWPETERYTSFHAIGQSQQGAALLASYVVENLHAASAYVVDNDTLAGNAFAEAFKERFRAHNGVIIGSDSIQFRMSDFNAILENVRIKKPDVVFFGGLADQAAMLVRNMRRLNIKAGFIHGMNGTSGLNLLRDAGAAADGVVALTPGIPAEKLSGWKNFEKNYLERFGGNITEYAPFAYDAAHVLIAAAKAANSTRPADVLAALYTIHHNGLTGNLAFDQSGNLINPTFTVYQMQQLRWTPVQTFGISK